MHQLASISRFLVALAVMAGTLVAQQATVRVGADGEVLASLSEVAPGDIGIESELSGQSVTAKAEGSIQLGKAKAGVWAVRYQLDDSRAFAQVLFIESKNGAWLVTDLGSAPLKVLPESAKAPYEKLWRRVDGELLRASVKRAQNELALTLGTQLPVVIIACGASLELPFMVVVCQEELAGTATSVARCLFESLLKEAQERRILTKEEADKIRQALTSAGFLTALLRKTDKVDLVLKALDVGLDWLDASDRTRFGAAVVGGTVKKAQVIRKVLP